MKKRPPKKTARAAAKLTMKDIEAAAKRLSNWGRWGKKDEIGTLNYTTPENIVDAGRLIRTGKVYSLALDFDQRGPQGGRKTSPAPIPRFNPIHLMTRTGTDAYSGVLDGRKLRSADDLVIFPLQATTQWDGLGHIFYGNYMYNGYDCRNVTTAGAAKCGIEKTKSKIVGRGVLIDVPRYLGKRWLPDGYAIRNGLLDEVLEQQGTEVRRGDFLLVRTGHMEAKLAAGSWDGYLADAPGLAFETLDWLHAKEVAAVATDTVGAEVIPNETDEAFQPWHWISIPMMGLTVGEIFYLAELAADCAADHRYDFFFVAPALPITGAVGSPTNPMAIR